MSYVGDSVTGVTYLKRRVSELEDELSKSRVRIDELEKELTKARPFLSQIGTGRPRMLKDVHKELIKGVVERDGMSANASLIYKELAKKHGYKGGYNTVSMYVRSLKNKQEQRS